MLIGGGALYIARFAAAEQVVSNPNDGHESVWIETQVSKSLPHHTVHAAQAVRCQLHWVSVIHHDALLSLAMRSLRFPIHTKDSIL